VLQKQKGHQPFPVMAFFLLSPGTGHQPPRKIITITPLIIRAESDSAVKMANAFGPGQKLKAVRYGVAKNPSVVSLLPKMPPSTLLPACLFRVWNDLHPFSSTNSKFSLTGKKKLA
jgi:hypothetical protein